MEKAIFKVGDQFVKLFNKKICIKIDVEGHEEYVIDGLVKLIKKNNILLQIEIFDHNKKIIFKKLRSLNLKKIYKIDDKLKSDYFFEKK